ncbi:bifunctional DNA-formamidopyrimidine glycosylase/DNA-(apurinic or apyrimidinic site) lyase [Marinobacter sp. X15-166B]|uniref:bifunctional DNA-formamidopyrimidine glycosylase/DNA-(apurinic or apyrimidinic site) lyase n=1 Tax=Marinobacter sp. X15-166B TaxID=1897620 RepID=UPI00085C7242|nr:bifunctional DNA-formamidopyrimidine glycosylase/DNA-(apurinic or apyrimidinic site) lyase [Marinobacter sp. X15-166B]OEY65842.1 DNA-formamidopyrimidine glycosylase [Marinobacter sp. X15-166B]
MPELPEVETTLRGIEPFCKHVTVAAVRVFNGRLRWPVPENLAALLEQQEILAVSRRAKYLLLRVPTGTLIIHLGMSGSLRVITDDAPLQRHDHVELTLATGVRLRYNDPRRFGCWLWAAAGDTHPLLTDLGPEPLSAEFNGAYLHAQAGNRKVAIKTFIMNGKIVVGVGNIYANEALFAAGIHPQRPAGNISLARCNRLVSHIKDTLGNAILQGGTTLKDFVNSDGKPGYFAQSLRVYGRGGQPCLTCGGTLKEVQMNQRTTVYCTRCQR